MSEEVIFVGAMVLVMLFVLAAPVLMVLGSTFSRTTRAIDERIASLIRPLKSPPDDDEHLF
jgi:cytochrome c oxidase assembly factor CtaG|tara:strand:- start:235 stop:417 length:183 start_codon:yes stop_codon:yes gene_type:complete